MSYTTFRYDNLHFSQPSISAGRVSQVSLTVTNSGSRAGDEVVQLYVHQDHTSLKRPVKQLEGFKGIALQPGESQTVTFPIGFEQVKFWKGGRWKMEPGNLSVMIGASSEDIRLKGDLALR